MPRALVVLLAVPVVLVLAACAAPEPNWDIAADGSCDPAQLQVKVVPRIDDDPALVVVDILLTNVTGTACTLAGVPSISITDVYDTKPIGSPAAPMDGTPAKVDLPPKGVAYVLLQTLKSLADSPTCVGVLANGMHIVLPGRTDASAIVTSSPVAKYCDEPSRATLLVSPITAKPLVVPGVENFVPEDY